MAAPTPTVRVAPAGIHLDDGYPTKVTFASKPNVSLWEKNVKPPGFDGGDAIEQTTMHNVAFRTKAPRSLKTLMDSTFTAAYDPGVITDIETLVNKRDTITITFPDGSTEAFFGYLQKWEPGDLKEGDQPEATCTIVPTNTDTTANHAESGPVVASIAGT